MSQSEMLPVSRDTSFAGQDGSQAASVANTSTVKRSLNVPPHTTIPVTAPRPDDDEDAKLVATLLLWTFLAKLGVTFLLYLIDGCAVVVFTLSVLGDVPTGVMQLTAAIGAGVGALCLALSIVFLPPTMSAYARIAASCCNKEEAFASDTTAQQVLKRCRTDGGWDVVMCLLFRSPPTRPGLPAANSSCLPGRLRDICRRALSIVNNFSASEMVSKVHGVVFRVIGAVLAVVFAAGLCYLSSWGMLWWWYSVVFCAINTIMSLVSLGFALCMQIRWSARIRTHCTRWHCSETTHSHKGQPDRLLLHLYRYARFYFEAYLMYLPEFGVGRLAGVWAWQGWVEVMPKVEAAVQRQHPQGAGWDPSDRAKCVLEMSILPATTRLLLRGRTMLKVYYLTEWVRIVLLAVAASLAAYWRAAHSHLQGSDTMLRVAMVALSLAVTYIKAVRDKWKLLERAMQQLTYGGALVLLFDWHLQCVGLWASSVNEVPAVPPLRCGDLVHKWGHVLDHLNSTTAAVNHHDGSYMECC